MFIPLLHNLQRPLIRPHRDRTSRRRLDQSNTKTSIEPLPSFTMNNNLTSLPNAFTIDRDFPSKISRSGWTLHLQSLPDQIQGEYSCLSQNTRKYACSRISGSKGQRKRSQNWTQCLISTEEETHIWHHLTHTGTQTLKEPLWSLSPPDISNATTQACVHPVWSLGSKARTKEVQRVGERGSCGSSYSTGDESFSSTWQFQRMNGPSSEPIGGELDGAIVDVEQLR